VASSPSDEDEPIWSFSKGDAAKVHRWRIAELAAWAATAAFLIAAIVSSGFGLKMSLLIGSGIALAIGLRASNRQRQHAPAPNLSGREIARYKAQAMGPRGTRSAPVWLVFDDVALYLLGRYYARDNAMLTFHDIACAQQLRGTILHKTVVRYVILVTRRGSLLRLATKDADDACTILGSHGVTVHGVIVERSNAALNLRGIDAAAHEGCLEA
jgi:hypothetical protein